MLKFWKYATQNENKTQVESVQIGKTLVFSYSPMYWVECGGLG